MGWEFRIMGEAVTRPRPETGLILQDHGLLPWATVEQNTQLGLTIRQFYGPDGRHAPKASTLDPSKANERVSYWLDRLGIADLRSKYPAPYAGGV